MAEEKRMEKLLKRAKPFLDEKLKAKQRLSSLWNFLDNTSEPDQCKFFQDHDFQVFNVFHECFSHQVDKIKAREKPDKLLSVNSKEVVDLMRVLQILRKVFVFLPERMRYGWQRKSIVGVLQTLLCTANHPKVRIEGFRLLLLYLNSHSSESAEVIPLYSNAFLLSVFDAFPFPLPANLANHDCEDPPIVGLDSRAEDLLGLGDDVMSPQGSYVAAEGMSSSRADTSNILLKDEWKGEGKGKLNQSSIEWERKVQTLTGATSSSGGGTTYKTHLLPSPTPFTTYDAVDLLEELLQNMVMAASGDIPATTTLPVASIASQYGSMLRIGGMGGGAISRHSSFAEMRAGSDSKADSVVGSTTAQPSTGIGLGITMSNTGVDEAPPAIPSPVGNRETELPVTHPGPGTGCLGADGLDAREKRLKFMWEIFQKYYLRLLFPKVSRKSGLQVADGEGFATCPPQLLHSLINFLIRQCLDPSAPTTSATALRNLLLNPNSPNCDMVHEWLRQAMLLPYMWSDVTRGAIAVIRAWCSVSNEARPAFLRAPTPLPDTSDEDDFLKDHEFEQGETNSYLRRYIRCMRLTFLQKSDSVEYINAQMTIFAEVLSLYRFIILDVSELHVSRQTRQTLTSTLLDITSQVLCQTDPCAVVPYPARAAEIADLLFETIFYTWVRCRMKDNKLWETLRKVLKECTRWKECIGQWGTVVLKLTNVMCKYVYQSDIDLNASCGQIPCSATDISRIIAANSTSASSNTTTVPNLAAIPHLKSVASVASAATTFSKIRDRSQSIYLASGVNVNPSGPSTSGSSTPTSTLVDRHERSSFLVPSTHSGSVASSMVRALSPQTRQKGDSNGMVSARSDPDLTAHTYSVEKDKAGTAMKGRDSEYRMGSNTVTEESTEDTRIETLPAPFLKDLHPTSTVSIQIDALENPSRIPILAVQHSVTMPEFVDLESLSFWDAENALFLWKNMVCVLGNVNEIEVPANHAAAMTFLLNVWDRLEKTRDSQPYASDSQQMPSLFEFAVWFFQAADMNDEFADGRAIAYSAICKTMCRRHDQAFHDDYYAHFYRLLIQGLASDDRKVVYAIFQNCQKFFALGLPGSFILVQPFIKCVRQMFLESSSKSQSQTIPENVRQDAIVILSSLICTPNHFARQSDIDMRLTPQSPNHLLRPSRMESKDGMHVGPEVSTSFPAPLEDSPAKVVSITSSLLDRRALTPPRPISTYQPQAAGNASSTAQSWSHPSPGSYSVTSPSHPSSNRNSLPPAVPSPSPAALAAAAAAAAAVPAPKVQSPAHSYNFSPSPNINVSRSSVIRADRRPSLSHQSSFDLFPNTEMGVPIVSHMQTADPPIMSFLDMKVAIKDVFLALATEERNPGRVERNPDTLAMLVWSVALVAFDEMMAARRPVKQIVDDSINILLDHLTVENLKVVHAAADGLTLFAQNKTLLGYLEKPVLQSIVEKIVGALTEQMMFQHGVTPHQVRGLIVSRLLYCLLEWVIILPSDVLALPKMAQMVFEVIENALTDTSDTTTALPDTSSSLNNTTARRPRMSIHEATAPFLGGAGNLAREGSRDRRSVIQFDGKIGENIGSIPQLNQATTGTTDDADSDLVIIKESAENVLMHIIHHFDAFSPPYGASMLSSQIIDPALCDDGGSNGERYLYFSFEKTTLITFVDVPGPTPIDSRARLIIRNMTGRYSWDTYLFYESLRKMQSRVERLADWSSGQATTDDADNDLPSRFDADPCLYQGVVPALTLADDIEIEHELRKFEPDVVLYSREPGTMPEWHSSADIETADMLDELLQYIGDAHPDCLLRDKTPLNVPSEEHAPTREAVGEIARQLQLQVDKEAECAKEFLCDTLGDGPRGTMFADGDAPVVESTGTSNVNLDQRKRVNSPPASPDAEGHLTPTEQPDNAIAMPTTSPLPNFEVNPSEPEAACPEAPAADFSAKSYVHVKPGPHPSSTPPFQRARLLLSHMGHVDFEGLKTGSFQLLGKSPALYRDIKVLDRKHGRETIKLAVIYVAPGQEDEQSIFQNSSGSIEYEEFIASLGWEIDLATHPGFLGGLERSLANGRVATYHCTATMEMLFHDVTKMPNDHNDPKQLKKKRHIGNDHVHIVWNEHYREYRRSTIGGDFGNAQIVITPRPDGLFAVSVLRDPKVPSFGPLHHQMIVSKKVLGPVVRQTASNAYRAALAMGDPTQKRHLAGVPLNRHAFAARREDIKTIAERHKVAKWTFERFVESVFATGAEGMVEQKEVVHPPGIGLSAGNGATTAAVTSPGQYRRNVSGTPA